MKRAFTVLMVAGAALASGLVAATSLAAAPVGATLASYVSHDGAMVVSGASVADAVNASDDGAFIQMGHDTSIVLSFAEGVNAQPDGSPAPDLVVDIFDGVWPACGHIYGSMDGTSWTSLISGAASHPGCPEALETTVGIDANGNYTDASQPLGSAATTGFSDTTDVMFDLDAYGGPVHFVKVVQADYIAIPYTLAGFDLDSVYALNTTPYSPVETGCVYSHGYFKKQGSSLVTGLELGDRTYTADEIRALLKEKGGGDTAVKRHLIAFLLSPGVSGPIYTGLVADAHALLSGGSGDASAHADLMGQHIETYHC